MITDRFQHELIELYNSTLDYDFRKDTYQEQIEYLKKKNEKLLRKIADVCENDPDKMEQTALCVPRYVAEKLSEISSKRKRRIKVLDYKMNMASYFIPLMGILPFSKASELTRKTVEYWNERMPEEKIGYSTYEGIKGGFKNGIFCYITTAVCRSLKKPDNCYELNIFRHFRDDYLHSCREGKDALREYYDHAPTIVKRINRDKNSDQIYKEIWSRYLSLCISLIEQGKNQECLDLYTKMVHSLEEKYLYQVNSL